MVRRLFAVAILAASFAAVAALAQQEGPKRGRHAELPPVTRVAVRVTRQSTGKPVANAEVIFHPLKNGEDTGTMELKTNHEGVAELDILPQNSSVRVQVIAPGFRTFGQDYNLTGDSQDIGVELQKPVDQYSSYHSPITTAPKPASDQPLGPQQKPATPDTNPSDK